MKNSKFKRKHINGIIFCVEQGLVDDGQFANWLVTLNTEDLDFLSEVCEEKEAMHLCDLIDMVLKIKVLSTIGKEQYN